MLLRTRLHPLIEHRAPDGPIALVERIHRGLLRAALVLATPVPKRQPPYLCRTGRYTADLPLVLETGGDTLPRNSALVANHVHTLT
jgi:hypothetical protein